MDTTNTPVQATAPTEQTAQALVSLPVGKLLPASTQTHYLFTGAKQWLSSIDPVSDDGASIEVCRFGGQPHAGKTVALCIEAGGFSLHRYLPPEDALSIGLALVAAAQDALTAKDARAAA